MAHIVIDGRMWSWTGVGRFTQRLVHELETLDKDTRYTLLLRSEDWDKWSPSTPNFSKQRADFNPYTWGEQTGLKRLLNQLRPDLVHFPAANRPIRYHGASLTHIHDLTLIDFKNVRGDWLRYTLKQWGFRYLLRRVVKSSAHLATSTVYVKTELLRRYRLDPLRITHVALAGDPLPGEPEEYPGVTEGQPFILSVGNAYPYKNLQLLTRAFGQLRAAHPELRLLIVGKLDYFTQALQKQVEQEQIENVIFTDFVPDSQLIWLYQRARAFAFPSLSEGFGLPGLEAMHYGLPVVAARASCLPEVYGDSALYFDPFDAADLAAKLEKVISDDQLHAQLVEKGKARVASYSWRKTAEQTLALYYELLAD